MTECLKQNDSHWNDIDLMARVREGKRRKAAEARRRLVLALASAASRRQVAVVPNKLADIMPRRPVAARPLTSPEGRELRLRAIDGPRKELLIKCNGRVFSLRGMNETRVSLPFNSFIHEEE